MNKLTKSWNLMKQSLQVIARNPKLLFFPVINCFVVIALALFFFIPVGWIGFHEPVGFMEGAREFFNSLFKSSDGSTSISMQGYLFLFVVYWALMAGGTFLNVAFYHEILNALKNSPVSLRGGFAFSFSRIKSILAWSLMAGLVGFGIKMLEERFSWVGRLILRLIGVAWSVASVFAVPVIICEQDSLNPVRTLKSSASLIQKTWGESFVGYIGTRMISFILFFGLLTVVGLTFVFGFLRGYETLFWMVAAGSLLMMMAAQYMISVANQVYRGALFLYAFEGKSPTEFQVNQSV